MYNTSKYVVNSFFWGSIAKVFDALIKFISIPLLITYFGKDDFGLISLAISVNAYLQLLDMGINTGAVKYFSEWIHKKKFDLLNSVARTSISFYGTVGIINALILIIIAFFGMNMFSITDNQSFILQDLFLVIALFAIINWSTSVFSQLLIANENIAYIQKINIIRSFLSLIVILVTIKLHWNLTTYFIWFTIINSFVLIPFFRKAKVSGLIKSILPAFDWTNFGIIFKYSLAIIAMSVFTVSSTTLRPIILGILSVDGIGIVADYKIMETITLFIISIGGMFISIFLPKTSKLLLENDKEKVAKFAYESTLNMSIIVVILSMPFILNAREIISVYVGRNYLYLTKWLILWLVTILCYLHNSPVASLVLSTGKTKMLVYSSAIACIVSIIINSIFCTQLGAGSAVIGYSVYILIQMTFYYFYFNNKILGLNSYKVFKSFIIPTLLGFMVVIIVRLINFQLENNYLQIVLKSSIWLILYCALLMKFKIISYKKIKTLVN
jgi:O-antigen/teichoic acid export membrane protein